MDADYCASGGELIKKRNILFTAITRSRGWVRVCGCGDGMKILLAEFGKLKEKGFTLDFTIPTRDELQKMRTLYRDITSDDRRKASDLKRALEKLPENVDEANAVIQSLPKELRDRIRRLTELED
jgi:superfamily I DNA and RNA helicase